MARPASRPTAASACHQLGNKATRTIATALGDVRLVVFRLGAPHPVRPGQRHHGRATSAALDTQRALKLFADWTDRIAEGELPKSKPERPQGVERNIVVTVWDWGTPTMYLHDEISTDRRNPTVNANGKIYGSPEWSTDFVPVLDPVNNRRLRHQDPGARSEDADRRRPIRCRRRRPIGATSRSGTARPAPHNPMIDEQGPRLVHRRASAGRRRRRSAARARIIPRPRPSRSTQSGRQLVDVRSEDREVHADRHLLQHPPSAIRCQGRRLWASSGVGGNGNGDVVGWLDRRCSTRPATSRSRRAGRRSSSTPTATASATTTSSPNQPVDPTKDKRVVAGFYGIAPSPADGTIWGSVLGFPGVDRAARSRRQSARLR